MSIRGYGPAACARGLTRVPEPGWLASPRSESDRRGSCFRRRMKPPSPCQRSFGSTSGIFVTAPYKATLGSWPPSRFVLFVSHQAPGPPAGLLVLVKPRQPMLSVVGLTACDHGGKIDREENRFSNSRTTGCLDGLVTPARSRSSTGAVMRRRRRASSTGSVFLEIFFVEASVEGSW